MSFNRFCIVLPLLFFRALFVCVCLSFAFISHIPMQIRFHAKSKILYWINLFLVSFVVNFDCCCCCCCPNVKCTLFLKQINSQKICNKINGCPMVHDARWATLWVRILIYLYDKMNDIAIAIILRWTEFRLLTRQLTKQINIYDWFSSLSGISSFEYFYWISMDKRTLSIYTWVGFFVICDFFLLSHKYTIGWNMQSNVNMFNTCHTIEQFFLKKNSTEKRLNDTKSFLSFTYAQLKF